MMQFLVMSDALGAPPSAHVDDSEVPEMVVTLFDEDQLLFEVIICRRPGPGATRRNMEKTTYRRLP